MTDHELRGKAKLRRACGVRFSLADVIFVMGIIDFWKYSNVSFVTLICSRGEI